jgi:spore coat protein CotF
MTQNQMLTDRDRMEGFLTAAKNACDLYLHGVMEASTPQVRQTFSRALNESLVMQDDIYRLMAKEGWYTSQQAQQQQIQQVRQKFVSQG